MKVAAAAARVRVRKSSSSSSTSFFEKWKPVEICKSWLICFLFLSAPLLLLSILVQFAPLRSERSE